MFEQYSTPKYRWLALVVLSLGLAIVIIDNTVLNVAIPYILRDLNASLDGLQWVISGYALIIATLLITIGRVGDMYGRKRVFMGGALLFAVGSLIASFAGSTFSLFIGEALIEAIGAAMMLTSTLSLIVSEFQGRERAIAFGVWGSVAGASASFGPLLGGYLTTYASWRWSLRINVVVALVVIIGSIFIQESKGRAGQKFDWLGTVLSGFGLFSLVFAIIEGQKFGWFKPNELFAIGSWQWHSTTFSIIPVAFAAAAVYLVLFAISQYVMEQNGSEPLLRLSLFKNAPFSFGLITLAIISLGQFGVFFTLPIYLQSVLGLDALGTGVVFLSASIALFITGPLSGFLATKISPKWVVSGGMVILSAGTYFVVHSLTTTATGWSLAPALIVFGIGAGATSSQLTNIILSAVLPQFSGEASSVNSTIRQVGTSIGIAIMGVVLSGSLTTHVQRNIQHDDLLPPALVHQLASAITPATLESGQLASMTSTLPAGSALSLKNDINDALTQATKAAMQTALYFMIAGTIASFLIPTKLLQHQHPVAERKEA